MVSKKINLCVPADRKMMLVIRMTTVGVMSRAGLTMDEMDDMKMAVDEACNLMLLQKNVYEALAVDYEIGEDSVSVCVEGQGEMENKADKADPNMQEVICCILKSMVDEVKVGSEKNGITRSVCLKKKLADCRRPAV